jgi:putative ABC transport system substrate-binding protein
MNKLDLYLSPKHAQEVGITLPQELISQAAQVEPAPKAKQ